ncbi:phage holin family protein [Pseudooctadecabacter sp.]|uniref:phage holin family protein n=1 Tax=Pseudooctadecabacter sp. TaxID=1966338 RepID=UPI0025CF3101|nr:phage holin family protein [Pseudooctadecabacter sp.]
MSHPDPRTAPHLIADTLRHFSGLMQKEVHLARAEMSNNISRAAMGVAFFGIAALMVLTALNVLAGAVVGYLTEGGMNAGTAALIVAAVFFAGALVLVLMGKSRLSADALAPTKTMHNVQRDVETVKGATHG